MDAKDMMLQDAIECAIEGQRRAIKYKRATIVLSIISTGLLVALCAFLIGG